MAVPNKFANLGGAPPEKCAICTKTIYAVLHPFQFYLILFQAELLRLEGKLFHKDCVDGRNFGAISIPAPENIIKPYCKVHWDRLVAAKGGDTTAISGSQSKWVK